MPNEILSLQQLKEMHGAIEGATQSDEPVAIQTDNVSVLNGDSTKMGANYPIDYNIVLYLPVTDSTPKDANLKMNGTCYEQIVTAEQKFITPRIARKVRNYATTVAIAFTKFEENGSSEIYTVEDIFTIFQLFDDNTIEACEKLISNVLGIPEHLLQYITDESLMENCVKVIKNNPSFFQED